MINWRKCHPDVELLWIIFLPCKGRQRLPNLLVRAVLSGAPDCPRDMYRINTTCYCSVVPYSSKWVSRHIAGDSSIQASVTRSPEREVLFSSASTADWLKLLPGRGQQPTVPHLSRDVNTCSSIRSLYRLRGLISEYSQLTALQRVYLEYWDTEIPTIPPPVTSYCCFGMRSTGMTPNPKHLYAPGTASTHLLASRSKTGSTCWVKHDILFI